MKRRIKIKETNYQRILIVSDIHGHYQHFKSFLERAKLTANDLLIINGDFINRGSESFKVLKLVQQLAMQENVIVLSGNHENSLLRFLDKKKRSKLLLKFLKKKFYPTLIAELYQRIPLKQREIMDDSLELCKLIRKKYQAELDFMRYLPIVVEGKKHIIVHSGYQEDLKIKKNLDSFIRDNDFVYAKEKHQKMIIVGHTPVCNIRSKISNYPLYNPKTNVYAIDGALGVKSSGELNALIIIPKAEYYDYQIWQFDDFKEGKTIADIYVEPAEYGNYRWPHWDFTLLEKGEVKSVYQHCHTGSKIMIFNDLLYKTEDSYRLKDDYCNSQLQLGSGQRIKIVQSIARASQIKYGDNFYWVATNSLSQL